MSMSEFNPIVGWQPSIPLPYYAGRKFRCTCKGFKGRKTKSVTFKTMIEYETHYFKAHLVASNQGDTHE